MKYRKRKDRHLHDIYLKMKEYNVVPIWYSKKSKRRLMRVFRRKHMLLITKT